MNDAPRCKCAGCTANRMVDALLIALDKAISDEGGVDIDVAQAATGQILAGTFEQIEDDDDRMRALAIHIETIREAVHDMMNIKPKRKLHS